MTPTKYEATPYDHLGMPGVGDAWGWCSVFKRVVFFCGAHDSCTWLRKAPQGVCSCSESGSGRCLRRRLNGHMKGQSTRNVQKVDAQSAAKLTQTSHEFPSCTLPSCLKKKNQMVPEPIHLFSHTVCTCAATPTPFPGPTG